MRKIFAEIKNITRENFSKYGTVLEHISKTEGYEPLVTVSSRGWIWAILTFKNKTIKSVECHPTSKESFEPVYGSSLIILAPPESPEKVEVFLLDKAVMLNEGVWHNLISLSEVSCVKITENNDVTGEIHEFGKEIGVALIYRE